MKKRYATCIFGLLLSLLLMGQTAPYPFKHIGVKEGLSNSFVLDITTDGQGFIWIATEAGLNRLAGNELTQYKTNNSLLASNELTSLHYDKTENLLWIATRMDGISLFDCHKQQFRRLTTENGLLSNFITRLAPAGDGGIWIIHLDRDIQHYDPARQQFSNYTQDEIPGLGWNGKVCTDDRNGHLYIGHNGGGMSILDLKQKRIRSYHHREGDPKSLPGDNVRSICIDQQGNIWVGTNCGLALFDPRTEKFTCFKHEPGNPFSLIGDNIQHIREMDDGTLWIAADVGGISTLQLSEWRKMMTTGVRFRNITDTNSGLSSANPRILHQDDFGNIWIGNYSSGLDCIARQPSDFRILPFFSEKEGVKKLKRIYGVEAGPEGELWLGSEDELILYREGRVTGSWDVTPYQKRSSSSIYVLKLDREGTLWMGINDDGVICYDPKQDRFRRIDLGRDYMDIRVFYEDAEGRMWIGTEGGLYSCHQGKARREEEVSRQLTSSCAFSIGQDRQGKLWIGTLGGGVQVFDEQCRQVAHLTTANGLHSDNINQIYLDTKGGLWIATYNGLAYVGDTRQPEQVEVYDERQGLKDCHVRALCQDRFGNIWMSTYTGIACWNIRKQQFSNYDFRDNVPIGGFMENSVAAAPDGTLYFGSLYGACCFHPQLMTDVPPVSPIRLIACEELEAQSEKGNPHLLMPDRKGVIQLSCHQNSIRLRFALSDYAQNEQVEYAYRMEGLDKAWYDTNGESYLLFRNLDPGHYTLHVKARLKNGEWDEGNKLAVRFHIHPPFWATWYAWIGYLLMAALAGYLILRAYIRKLQLENSLELEKNSLELEKRNRQHEQELNNERLRFYTNITHELRTPLTLILGPLEDLVNDRELPEKQNRKIKTIHASALRLLNLINQLLEFRKTETQNRRLTVARGDLNGLVTEIGLRYKELNRNEKVAFRIETEAIGQTVYYDADIVTTIVNNLLSNAMKYTPEGEICLRLHTVEKAGSRYAEIRVSDTGYGIEPQALPHIFDRYYQAEGKHQASGTGIGLALVKSLADLHEGILEVESQPGKGTTFTFHILTDYSYPEALHKEAASAASPANQETTQEAEEADTRPALLVVEDNDDIRDYIAESLEADYRISTARNGREGLELAQQQAPNIIVSDIMMPEMDGIELCRRVKEDIRTSHIPVILLTAKDTLQDKEEGYESGADSYLTKPFSAKLLRSRIHNLLETRRKLARLSIGIAPESPADSQPTSEPIAGLNRLDKEFLEKLTALVEQNLDAEKLDIAFMTDKMNMSYSTLYRKVKALTGLSVSELTRKIKLKNSARLLQSGKYNVAEVAAMTGFNNAGYFRECFKEAYGVAPSAYGRQHKKETKEEE